MNTPDEAATEEARFRALMEYSSDAILLLDRDLRMIYVSAALPRILGHARDVLRGQSVFASIHPDDRTPTRAFYDRVLKSPCVPIRGEGRWAHSDGSWRWIEGVACNRLDDPAVRAIVVNCRDETERRQSEEETRRIISSAPCLLWHATVEKRDEGFMWDLKQIDVPAAQRFLPLVIPPGSDYSHAWEESKLPEDRQRMDERAHEALCNDAPHYSQEFRCVDATGRLRWLHEDVYVESVGPCRWRLVGVCTDISERKRGELVQSVLYEIADAVHTSSDLPQLFASIHRSLMPLLDARNFYIALVTPDRPDVISFPYGVDERDRYLPGEHHLPDSLTAHIVRTRRPALLTASDIEALADTDGVRYYGALPARWLGAPLIADTEVIGVVAVQNYEDPHAYSDRDLEVIVFVAAEIAAAIQRKRTQDRLRHEQRLLHTLMAHVPDPIFFKDAEGAYTRVNRATAETLGLDDPEDAVGRTARDFLPPDEVRAVEEEDARAMNGETLQNRTRRVKLLDGSARWVMASKARIVNADGRPAGIVGVAKDVTELKETEEALRRSEARNRALLQAIPDLMFRIDREGTFLDVKSVDSIPLLLPEKDVIGRKVSDLFPESADTIHALIDRALRSGEVQMRDYTLFVDDALRHFETRYVRCADDEVLAIVRDITELSRNAAKQEAIGEITHRFLQAEASDAVLGQVVEILSDKLQFPIAAVQRYDPSSREMEFVGTCGVPDGLSIPKRLSADETIAGYVAESRERVVEPDMRTRDAHDRCALLRGIGVRALLCVPIRAGDRVIGSLCLADTRIRRDVEALADTLETIALYLAEGIERQRAEAALRESEDRYRRLAENAPDIIYRIGVQPEPHFEYVSPAVEKIIGYSPAEHYADPGLPYKIVHPEDQPFLGHVRQGRIPWGEPVPMRWYSKDGRLVWTEHRLTPVRDERGRLLAIEGIARDTTEQHNAEAARQRSEEQLRCLFECSLIGVALLGLDGTILRANPALHSMLSFEVGELTGRHFTEFTVPHYDEGESGPANSLELEAFRADDFDIFRRLVTGAIPEYRDEAEYVTKDGRTLYVRLGASVARSPDGEPQYVVAVVEDLTSLRQAQQSLTKLNEELERRVHERTIALAETAEQLTRSNEELQEFAHVTSHDLREPLRMVTSFLQLLQSRYGGKLGADADEFIAYAVDGAVRMDRLITSLLEYSRIDTLGGKFGPTDCEKVVAGVVRDLHAMIEETRAVIRREALPTIIADNTQLGQLFQNLIENAIKFRGTHDPRIEISAQRTRAHWRFLIRDNGIGIAPKDRKRVFGVFQRLHGHDDYPGSGIGLAVCKRIVERHGGKIWVESAPGGGSTFIFTIPVEPSIR